MEGIVGDIVIYGSTREEHDSNLLHLLDRACENGTRFNPDQCTIVVNEVPFFCHIIDDMGLKPDPLKKEVIVKLDAPD